MRRTLISAVLGFAFAGLVYYGVTFAQGLQTAAYVAQLQGQDVSAWLDVEDLQVHDGSNQAGVITEPTVDLNVLAKRQLEARIAISNRNVKTGEPVCVGGTLTVLLDAQRQINSTRPLSRLAGVDHCDWPVGTYRARIGWTLTDPSTRVVKTFVVESNPFNVAP